MQIFLLVFLVLAFPGIVGLCSGWRFHSRRDDEFPGWTRQSHLRVSTGCQQCTWPTHSGSSLFRLFRGRRSPRARLGRVVDPNYTWPPKWLTDSSAKSPLAYKPPVRLSPIANGYSPAAAFAFRRGSEKQANPMRMLGTRMANHPPRVTVVVHGLDGQAYATTLPLRPQATVYDVMTQAAARYREAHPKDSVNPFGLVVQPTVAPGGCLKVESIGPWASEADGVWEYTSEDSLGRVRTYLLFFIALFS
ncbi:hypothetical protein RvY_17611 [Ramazzottius varieornatus]|uniref:Uncharacterized protein n=1 Tax=Ramazzottius varieornatus TaxID=947166 RepID=A0A1D1W6H7_RAMVA|nr:hypothetical protein RvY_17611 [Ramazzottius varieornatus]